MRLIPRVRKFPESLVETISRCPQRPRALLLQQIRKLTTADLTDLDARKGDRERVVILGSGWAGQFGFFHPEVQSIEFAQAMLSRGNCPPRNTRLYLFPRGHISSSRLFQIQLPSALSNFEPH